MTLPLQDIQDSAKFRETSAEDPAMAAPMEGGYVVTRPRFTRRPRRQFTTGWTDLTDAQRITIRNFYEARRGGGESFSYTHPTDGTVHTVRFKRGQIPAYDYAGFGNTYRWNIDNVVLEEV